MSPAIPDPLMSAPALHGLLGQVDILDATYFSPPDPARIQAEFEAGRIPSARLFDIDAISDHASDLPHMLPTDVQFSQALQELGIDGSRPIIVYDRSINHFSAPRVWFTLKAFGLRDVRVLDGGLLAWRAAGLPEDSGPPAPVPAVALTAWRLDRARIADLAEIERIVVDRAQPIIDARAAERFHGWAAEPRPGLRAGHMPGAFNQPFDQLTATDGTFASAEALAQIFAAIPQGPQPVLSCGSGMTAAVLALGLARLGRDARLYDGSWSEWGSKGSVVEITPAKA